MNYLRLLNKKSSSRNKLGEDQDIDERIFTPKAKILSDADEKNNNSNKWSLKVLSPILSKRSTNYQTGGTGTNNNNNSKAKFSEGLDFSEIRMNHNNEHDNNKYSKKLGKCFLKTKKKILSWKLQRKQKWKITKSSNAAKVFISFTKITMNIKIKRISWLYNKI